MITPTSLINKRYFNNELEKNNNKEEEKIILINRCNKKRIREITPINKNFAKNDYINNNISNKEEVLVYRDKKFVHCESKTLRSGEIVLVYENRPIPADMVLIDSGMKEGVCYMETSSLDGEKNLKLKVASQKIYGI